MAASLSEVDAGKDYYSDFASDFQAGPRSSRDLGKKMLPQENGARDPFPLFIAAV